jgi:hypothetical protein
MCCSPHSKEIGNTFRPFSGIFHIAGYPIEIISFSKQANDTFHRFFSPFFIEQSTSLTNPKITVEFHYRRNLKEYQIASHSLANFFVRRSKDRAFISRRDFKGFRYKSTNLFRWKFSVDNRSPAAHYAVIMTALVDAILEDCGLVIHSSGVLRDNKLYLFSGPSGSGKTTISTVLKNRGKTFSVDRVALRPGYSENEWIAYPTPHSDNECQVEVIESITPSSILFVTQSHRHALKKLPEHEAAKEILQNVFSMGKETDMILQMLDSAASLAKTIPCYSLEFTRDEGFWSLVERGERSLGN